MIPVAWLQLKKEKLRLLIALAGVGFAVMLVFMQLGFRAALFKSSVRVHERLRYDLAMISPKSPSLIYMQAFNRRRLAQVRGIETVRSTSDVYIRFGDWRNPADRRDRRFIAAIGFDPSVPTFDLPGLDAQLRLLNHPDVALFDEYSRPEFGPIPALFRDSGRVRVEVGERQVDVVGLVRLGTSFGIDATILTSGLNYRRMFPDTGRGDIHLGLIRLDDGADPSVVRERIESNIPDDVVILTRDEFVRREIDHWKKATPVGFIFDLGALIGLIVGAIIVYQILYSDVSEHLREYATLKAMGFGDGYLSGIVIQQGLILAVIGFVPGALVAILLYRAAGEATMLPLEMTAGRAVLVLGLTIAMCLFSGIVALRKVRSADPADVF